MNGRCTQDIDHFSKISINRVNYAAVIPMLHFLESKESGCASKLTAAILNTLPSMSPPRIISQCFRLGAMDPKDCTLVWNWVQMHMFCNPTRSK